MVFLEKQTLSILLKSGKTQKGKIFKVKLTKTHTHKMVEDDNNKFYKQKHEINIALASQLRLSSLLDRIAILDANYPFDSPEKQKCYLNLVKQYFISAVPYLSLTDTKKFKDEIFKFNISRRSDVTKGVQRFNYQFDPQLDLKLNEILVRLQIKLRKIFTKVKDEEEDGL